MDKYEIVRKIEQFAPPELAEKWDCSGWLVETSANEVQKVMLALTVTQYVVNQAQEQNCDMIVSHHPLFCVPLEWHNIDIYCAHTNMDRTKGGTTDILVKTIFPRPLRERVEFLSEQSELRNSGEGFLRYISYETTIEDFIRILEQISPNLRYVNNHGIKKLHKIAFCAGSGSEFIQEAFENGADAFVTGDLKFHPALESPIVLFDIGHFESEIMILDVFERLAGNNVEIVKAKECSPFQCIDIS